MYLVLSFPSAAISKIMTHFDSIFLNKTAIGVDRSLNYSPAWELNRDRSCLNSSAPFQAWNATAFCFVVLYRCEWLSCVNVRLVLETCWLRIASCVLGVFLLGFISLTVFFVLGDCRGTTIRQVDSEVVRWPGCGF